LIATYGCDRPAGRPLRFGSMKSNLGHTQSAGGVGGVMKMIMAMRNDLLPKTLHVDAPSQLIDWSSGTVSLLVEPVPWHGDGEPRRAAVHSFGVSGTNVHLIIEEPAPLEAPPPAEERRARLERRSHTPVPWPLSGVGEDGLRRQARRLAEFLAEQPGLDIADIGRSLAARPVLSHRAVPIGANRTELLEDLEKVAAGTWTIEVAAGVEDSQSREALASLAQTWVAGSAVDWAPVFAELDARPVRLPTYAFAHRRHWVDHSPVWAVTGPAVEVGRQAEEAFALAPDGASLAGGADQGQSARGMVAQ
jgi:acyl transferase domain-containing protein